MARWLAVLWQPWRGLGITSHDQPRFTTQGVVSLIIVHAWAFTFLAHCHYWIYPPRGLFWFASELLLAFALWPIVRSLVAYLAPAYRSIPTGWRWLPVPIGCVVAIWWNGNYDTTFWRVGRTLGSILPVLLVPAYAGCVASLSAAIFALLQLTESNDPAVEESHTHKPWDRGTFIVIVLFIIATNALAIWFVSREQALYFVDFMFYWISAANWAEESSRSLTDGWRTFRTSVQQPGYTLIPAIIPASVMALVSDHRLVFILAIVNGHLLPVLFAALLFVRRFVPHADWKVTAVTAAWLAPLPVVWPPILRGFPDVGGVALCILSLWLYLRKPLLKLRWPDLLAIAAVLAAVALFRRWYSFWVIAFGLLTALDGGWQCLGHVRQRSWRSALCSLRPAPVIGILTGLILFAVAAPMVRSVAQASYGDAYAAYRSSLPVAARALALVDELGWFSVGMAFLSAFILLRVPELRRPVLITAAMVPVMVLHFLRIQDFNSHHMYLLMPALLLLPALASGRAICELSTSLTILVSTLLFGIGALLLAPVLDKRAEPIRTVLTPLTPGSHCRPFIRNDLPEWRRLLAFIDEETARTGEPFVLLASSQDCHATMLSAAERSLRQSFPAAKYQLSTSEVDRVNGFPSSVFQAKLVLVADPPQTHLPDVREQQTLVIPARQLLKGSGIAAGFARQPETFHLQNGVTVHVFRRVRPIELATFQAFQDELRKVHPDRVNVYTPTVPVEELLAMPADR